MANKDIFKSYDIRGIYPEELSQEVAFRIGKAFANKTTALKIAVGRDGRLSSDILFESLVKGIISQGKNVCDLGQVPTECLYFAVGNYDDIGAGIMITASHNPKEYNGFKMITKNATMVEIIRGKDLYDAVCAGESKEPKAEGIIEQRDVLDDYISHILKFVDLGKIKNLKVVVDSGNGMASKIIPFLKGRITADIYEINSEIDGNFPARGPNPLLDNASDTIEKAIKEKNADLGFMFDGDSDRIFLVDENGSLISADITLLLLAEYFLLKNPKMAVSYNLLCSKAVPEFILKWGGRPIRTKVGFVNVREGMMENNGIMGGELSGHYCFKDNFYLDSGFISFLAILELVSQSGKKVSEIIKELSIYYKEPALEFKVDNAQKILGLIKERYKDGKQDELDGISIEYEDWWFNARSSQTEPVFRFTIEAKTKEIFDQRKKELQKLITD
jgi:phosphomannomutase